MAQPLIQLEKVAKSFGLNDVLKKVDISIFKGEITTIIGKSGTGKSVLLKHMIGLLRPDSGRVLYNGKSLLKMRGDERRLFKKKVSYVFQGNALFDSMTVFENVALALTERTSLSKTEIGQKVRKKLDQLELVDVDDKYPSQISGGMKKRVSLARALVTDPEIVLFDEPTTGLDPIRKHAVHHMISDYQKQLGFTGVIVSHEIPDIFYISQRIIMLDEGNIIFEGTPNELQADQNATIQEFIKGIGRLQEELTGGLQIQGEKRFHEEMDRFQRYGIPFTIILLTIDNMDEINRSIGHMAAQTVMKDFAAHVQKHLRMIDFCSRCGMNKLMIILSGSNIERARKVCMRLSTELSGNELVGIEPYPEFCFAVTAGFMEVQTGDTLEDLLVKAGSRKDMGYAFRIC